MAADEIESSAPAESNASDVAELDQEGRLVNELVCLGCGYNLRGLSPGSSCPECGEAVQQTLCPAAWPPFAPSWRLRRLKRAVSWLVVGFATQQIILYGIALTGFAAAQLAFVAPIAVIVLGIWQLTSPELHLSRSQDLGWWQELARWGSVTGLAIRFIGEVLWYVGPEVAIQTQQANRSLHISSVQYLIYHMVWGATVFSLVILLRSINARLTRGSVRRQWQAIGYTLALLHGLIGISVGVKLSGLSFSYQDEAVGVAMIVWTLISCWLIVLLFLFRRRLGRLPSDPEL
jgi:hypothetical protein